MSQQAYRGWLMDMRKGKKEAALIPYDCSLVQEIEQIRSGNSKR